jgi:hypothetical protein
MSITPEVKNKKKQSQKTKKAFGPGRHSAVLPGTNAFVRVTHHFAVEVMSRCLCYCNSCANLVRVGGSLFGAISSA